MAQKEAQKRKEKARNKTFNPVTSMQELRLKRERSGLPDAQRRELEQLDSEKKAGRGLKIKVTSLGGNRPHIHTAQVDRNGNGKTRRTFDDEPHTHDIAGGVVQEAGMVPHSHELEEA